LKNLNNEKLPKNIAILKVLVDINAESNSYFFKLNKYDQFNILNTLKLLKNNLSVDYDKVELALFTIDIYIEKFGKISVVNNHVYVSNNNVYEVFLDSNNLIRDIIMEKALNNDFDRISYLLRLIFSRRTIAKVFPSYII
jgi:hypothetical protein